jgi:C-terminal processing protease CtpA/Prc
MSHQFKDGYAIKLTITEYLTPNGDHVQEKGIEPDVKATDEDILDKALDELKD